MINYNIYIMYPLMQTGSKPGHYNDFVDDVLNVDDDDDNVDDDQDDVDLPYGIDDDDDDNVDAHDYDTCHNTSGYCKT